ncbi:MAG TPA: hypothetical protein VKB23_05085 [Solirubrobacterales bacterium]|nr:hypothetical protein [Solirubrobacterales bacterium]
MSAGSRHPRAAGIAAALCAAALLALAGPATAAGPPGGLDSRAFELVSPVEKNGGVVGPPGSFFTGVLQAGVQDGAVAFGSPASFGEAVGSLPVNQYLATRGAAGWSSENVTPSALSGTYSAGAYELFSADLGSAILNNGWRCRDGSGSCAVENPPLAPGAPPGYRNLYLREADTFTPLVTSTFPSLPSEPQDFQLAFEGASPDLHHVVFSAEGSLYEWSEGFVEVISSDPGAALASGPGAVSADGSRVYWTLAGNLHLREGGGSRLVAAGASFQTASRDGSRAYFIQGEHLYRYQATSEALSDLTSAGGALAVIGLSDDGGVIYYVTSNGLHRFAAGASTRLLATGPSTLPPASGRAQASADGARFFFTSPAALLFHDTDGSADVYEWEAGGRGTCVQAGGCLALISDGRLGGAAFAGASASGDDAYFVTSAPLLPRDPDAALDLYDARVGGGFPEPEAQVCFGDDCQGPSPVPDYEPPPTASLPGLGNRAVSFPRNCKPHKQRRKHKGCKRRHHRAHHRHEGGRSERAKAGR